MLLLDVAPDGSETVLAFSDLDMVCVFSRAMRDEIDAGRSVNFHWDCKRTNHTVSRAPIGSVATATTMYPEDLS